MLPNSIIKFLNSLHHKQIKQFNPVGGGSINHAYRYSVDGKDFL